MREREREREREKEPLKIIHNAEIVKLVKVNFYEKKKMGKAFLV